MNAGINEAEVRRLLPEIEVLSKCGITGYHQCFGQRISWIQI